MLLLETLLDSFGRTVILSKNIPTDTVDRRRLESKNRDSPSLDRICDQSEKTAWSEQFAQQEFRCYYCCWFLGNIFSRMPDVSAVKHALSATDCYS